MTSTDYLVRPNALIHLSTSITQSLSQPLRQFHCFFLSFLNDDGQIGHICPHQERRAVVHCKEEDDEEIDETSSDVYLHLRRSDRLRLHNRQPSGKQKSNFSQHIKDTMRSQRSHLTTRDSDNPTDRVGMNNSCNKWIQSSG